MIKVIIMLIKIINHIYFNLLLYNDMEQFYYLSIHSIIPVKFGIWNMKVYVKA